PPQPKHTLKKTAHTTKKGGVKMDEKKDEYYYLNETEHEYYKGVACAYLCAACPYAGTGGCGFFGNGFCINLKQ
ncbi:MAG: hypothetical protein IKC56_00025, partial [Clostridia bacterium]|nr:hypothetical protein [Clostridia bacterium]